MKKLMVIGKRGGIKRYFGIGKESNSSVAIGMAGSDRGVGTTAVALGFAGYLKNVCNCRTLVVQYTKVGRSLDKTYEKRLINGIRVEAFDRSKSIQNYFDRGYRAVIFDIEGMGEKAMQVLSCCSVKYITGSLVPWKAEAMYRAAELAKENGCLDRIYFIVTSGDTKSVMEFSCKTGAKVLLFPYMEKPPYLTEKQIKFYYSLM